ncbi:unnamed protein product [Sphagnum jensenii]|uniref:Chloride conductance regulatory protein ICln n=1 Tax=Sphagnum jensenii TaxID=128206 RepID=A0ABP1A873_9BRYO
MARGLVSVNERSEDGGPFLETVNEERVAHVQPSVGIVLGESPAEQPGTLYVTTRRLVWLSDEDMHKGYAVDFLSLTMHAISRDEDAYPQPCIYSQIDGGEDEDEEYEEDGTDDGAEEPLESENHGSVGDFSHVTEMRLVPRDASSLDHLFQVLCDCAALNPDPEGEQEGEGDWFFNEDEVMSNVIGGDRANNHVDLAELLMQDPRFEDADEEESGT